MYLNLVDLFIYIIYTIALSYRGYVISIDAQSRLCLLMIPYGGVLLPVGGGVALFSTNICNT